MALQSYYLVLQTNINSYEGASVLLMDLQKAFDSLNWSFIFAILRSSRFGDFFINFGKRYSWELVSNFITNNYTAKIQLKIFGGTFRLISGAIVNAKKLTLCWVLSHDAKKRET